MLLSRPEKSFLPGSKAAALKKTFSSRFKGGSLEKTTFFKRILNPEDLQNCPESCIKKQF
jgi:hypothetical protein